MRSALVPLIPQALDRITTRADRLDHNDDAQSECTRVIIMQVGLEVVCM